MEDLKKQIIDNIKIFKTQLDSSSLNISFDELDKYFYIEDYFSSKDTPYFKKKFANELLNICGKGIKGLLSNLEYYVNVSGSTPATTSDAEVLIDKKEINKLYFKFHLMHKKYNMLYLNHLENTVSVFGYLKEALENIKAYYLLSIEIEEKMIENMNKKLKELDNTPKPQVTSSIYH